MRHGIRTPQVADQAAWALGNLAADSAELRDIVLEAGALQMLVNVRSLWRAA